MFAFLRNRRVRKVKQQKERGYEWAAGQLLRGIPQEYVESTLLGTEGDSWTRTFGHGAQQAIIDYRALKENYNGS